MLSVLYFSAALGWRVLHPAKPAGVLVPLFRFQRMLQRALGQRQRTSTRAGPLKTICLEQYASYRARSTGLFLRHLAGRATRMRAQLERCCRLTWICNDYNRGWAQQCSRAGSSGTWGTNMSGKRDNSSTRPGRHNNIILKVLYLFISPLFFPISFFF